LLFPFYCCVFCDNEVFPPSPLPATIFVHHYKSSPPAFLILAPFPLQRNSDALYFRFPFLGPRFNSGSLPFLLFPPPTRTLANFRWVVGISARCASPFFLPDEDPVSPPLRGPLNDHDVRCSWIWTFFSSSPPRKDGPLAASSRNFLANPSVIWMRRSLPPSPFLFYAATVA